MTQSHPPTKPKIAHYWLAAARAEFARPDDWRVWADKVIISVPTPPYWIIAMSTTLNAPELEKVLNAEALEKVEGITAATMDDAIIGYIWWKFERKEIGLHRCLELMGLSADASNSTISCEAFYSILNELEAGIRSEKDIEKEVKVLVSPLQRLAEEQWLEIQSCV